MFLWAKVSFGRKLHAMWDAFVIVATPEAGSFAKHTGLRRHMRGNSEVEEQDVDFPFVIRPTGKDGDRIDELLRRFERYAPGPLSPYAEE